MNKIEKWVDVEERARGLALGIVLSSDNLVDEYDKVIRTLRERAWSEQYPDGIFPYQVYEGLSCEQLADEIDGIRAAIKVAFMNEEG
jgi:hypothetical protein